MTVTGTSTVIDRVHEAEIIRALHTHGPMSRSTLSREIGVGRSTVSAVLSRLLADDTVVIIGTDQSQRPGRPSENLQLNDSGVAAIGVDCTYAGMSVAAVTVSGDVIREVDIPCPEASWSQLSDAFGRAVAELDLDPRQLSPLRGVGVGIRGPVRMAYRWIDPDVDLPPEPDVSDDILGSPGSFDFLRTIGSTFNVPMLVDNTVRCAAYAEHVAAAPIYGPPTLFVRCLRGVGGAIVGRAGSGRGATGMTAEVGHLPVDPAGRRCRCGRRGCLETVAGTPEIVRQIAEAGSSADTVASIRDAHMAGDTRVTAVLERVGDALGQAILQAATIIDPAWIVVGGDAIDMGDVVMEALIARYREGMGVRFHEVPITQGLLHGGGGALGAALAVIHWDLPTLGPS